MISVAVDKDAEKELKNYAIKDVKVLKRSSGKSEEKVNMEELKQLED